VETLSLDMERRVVASPDATRRALISALERMRFSVDSVRGTVIEAHTGSPWLPHFGERRPLRARAVVVSYGDVVKISLHLTDGEEVVLDSTGAARVYARLFTEVCENLDESLRQVDPQMASTPPPPLEVNDDRLSRQGQLNAVIHRLSSTLMTRSADSPRSIRLEAPGCFAIVDPESTKEILAIASVVRRDTTIPKSLMETLDSVQSAVERAARLGDSTPVTLDERGKRVVDFLHRQLAARRQHPMRELLKCRDCGLEKISNPDLRKGNGSKMAWGLAGAAASLAYNPLSAVSVAGRLMGVRQLGQRFTCTRCQGLHVEVTPATICPQCSTIRKEFVLRRCPTEQCGYDFLGETTAASIWTPGKLEEPAEPPVNSHHSQVGPQIDQDTPTSNPPFATDQGNGSKGADQPPPDSSRSAGAEAPGPRPKEHVVPEGWYADPAGRHEWRWFDGDDWTPHVSDHGELSTDDV